MARTSLPDWATDIALKNKISPSLLNELWRGEHPKYKTLLT